MEFEPPDFKNEASGSGETYIKDNSVYPSYSSKNSFDSPLMRPPVQPHLNGYNKNRNAQQNNQFKVRIQDRLGARTGFPQNRNNNRNKDQLHYPNPNNNNNIGQNKNNFPRKRPADGNGGPTFQKRKWGNKAPYHHQNTGHQQSNVSVQNRLNRIRNNQDIIPMNPVKQAPVSDFNDSMSELDPTDITVEVVNNVASAPSGSGEDSNHLTRFKMILDAKAQAAIKVLQQKRRDKQVIYPLPVTPNVTGISIHERFSQL